MGARICPRCSTRVDERRAKTSPFCLSCGAELGPQSSAVLMPMPMGGGPSPTFAGKLPAAGRKSALPWILGGVGLLVLFGVGGVFLLLLATSDDDAKPPVPASTAAAAPKVETPDAASSVVASASASGKAPAPTVVALPTRVPTVTNPFTATPPVPTPPPTVTVVRVDAAAPAAPLGPFPRAKAQAEVDRVAGSIGTCTRASGPFGATTVRVDFEPDGRVGTVTQPPFAGTPVGSCISARFLAIRIGPFQGSTTSISRSFIIQQ